MILQPYIENDCWLDMKRCPRKREMGMAPEIRTTRKAQR
jgi:hypothetical protein